MDLEKISQPSVWPAGWCTCNHEVFVKQAMKIKKYTVKRQSHENKNYPLEIMAEYWLC